MIGSGSNLKRDAAMRKRLVLIAQDDEEPVLPQHDTALLIGGSISSATAISY